MWFIELDYLVHEYTKYFLVGCCRSVACSLSAFAQNVANKSLDCNEKSKQETNSYNRSLKKQSERLADQPLACELLKDLEVIKGRVVILTLLSGAHS
jgi:hypothetical protein